MAKGDNQLSMSLELDTAGEETTDMKETVNNNNIQGKENANPLDLNHCQNLLKADYRTNRSGIVILPGMSEDFSVDNFFVDLALIKEDKRPGHVNEMKLERFTDLLTPENHMRNRLHHVLVKGEMGTGKTTMINQLAYQWAIQPDEDSNNAVCNKIQYPLSRFQLVFTLDIKTFQAKMDLVDWIQDQLLPDMSKLVIKSLLVAHSDKCLFLFDAFNELQSHNQALDSKFLLSSCVVVTTRLNKVDEFCQNHSGYIHVKLAGFSDTSKETFVTKYIDRVSKTMTQREIFVRANIRLEKICNSHLNYLSFHPLLLTLICIIWNKVGQLPTRITTLYKQSIAVSALHMYTQNYPEKTSTYHHNVKLNNLLLYLGSTALDALLLKDKKLIFEREDFKARSQIQFLPDRLWVGLCFGCLFACVGMEVGLRVGSVGLQLALSLLGVVLGCIMFTFRVNDVLDLFDDAEKLRLLTKIRGNRKGSHGNPKYSFIHMTFQEFCAAIFWSSLAESNRRQFESYLMHIDSSNVYDLQYLLRFCCGLSSEAAGIILQHVVNNCKLDWRLPVTLLFEAESASHIQPKLHAILKPLKSLKTYSTMSSNLWAILNHYLCHKGISSRIQTWLTDVEELCVNVPYTGMKSNQFLSKVSESDSFSRSLKALSLDVSYPMNDKLFTIFLRQQLQLCHLKIRFQCSTSLPKSKVYTKSVFSRLLPVPHPTAYEDAVTYFDIIIPNLKTLSLVNTGMGIHQWERLLGIIIDTGKRLQMQNLSIGSPDDLVGEAECLPMLRLDLMGNDLFEYKENDRNDALLHRFAEALSYLSGLKHLGLNNTGLTGKSLQVLGPAISKLSNLQSLDLGRIRNSKSLLDQAKTRLSYCLQNLEDLRNFDLHCTGIDDDDFGKLSFERLPELSELNLSCNAFGSQGLFVCSVSLKHVPKLNKLKLSDNEMGDQAVIAFSASLKHVPLLTTLDLSGITIGVNGLIAINASMKHISLLTSLKLTGRNVGIQGAIGYRTLLQHIPLLKCLSITAIESECLIALAEGFCHIPQLTDLELLSGMKISVEAAEALFRNLSHVPNLNHLSFPHIDYTNLAESDVVKACLQEIPSIHDEDLVYLCRSEITVIVSTVKNISCDGN